MPLAILHWRVGVIRDIVLQGFELELYSPDEIPFAYWYLSRVLQEDVILLLNMRAGMPEGEPDLIELFIVESAKNGARRVAYCHFLGLPAGACFITQGDVDRVLHRM